MRWIARSFVRCTSLMFVIVAASGLLLASSGNCPGWAIADFDGDNRPDVAIANPSRRNTHELEVQLSTRSNNQIAAPALPASSLGFHLSPRDVDGDHDLDIVVTAGILRQPVAIWINDGQGGFSEGDLLSYPAPSGWETQLIPPEMPTSFARGLLTPGRRSRFGLAPSGGLLRTGARTAILAFERHHFLGSACLGKNRDARAPPASLSFLRK